MINFSHHTFLSTTASLLYFNADNVRQVILDRVRTVSLLRLVIGDPSNSPYVDLSGARMLAKLEKPMLLTVLIEEIQEICRHQ